MPNKIRVKSPARILNKSGKERRSVGKVAVLARQLWDEWSRCWSFDA